MIFGLGFELIQKPEIETVTAGRGLGDVSAKSVFVYLEQQRKKSSAGLGS